VTVAGRVPAGRRPAAAGIPERFGLSPGVRYRVVEDRAVIVHQESGEILGLDETGTAILEMAASGLSVPEIVDELGRRYSVEHSRLTDDVVRFLGELAAARVLVGREDEGRG